MDIDTKITIATHRISQLKKESATKNFLFYTAQEAAEWRRKNKRALAVQRSFLGYLMRKQTDIILQIY